MRFTNKITGHSIRTVRRKSTINMFGVPTVMTEMGISVLEDDDNLFQEHISNCLDSQIVLKYVKRFLLCQSKQEITYIKLLAKRGLFEGDETLADGKEAKILYWTESNQYYPMYVCKTKSGQWGKSKRLIYSTTTLEGHSDFNTRVLKK